jgi:hypothetical protein
MAILAINTSFADNNQVTATTLNNAINNATFAANAVINAQGTSISSGAIIVIDGGITAAKLATGVNGALFIGNGTGFTNTTLTAGNGIAVTNASGAITVSNASLTSNLTPAQYYLTMVDKTDTTGKRLMVSTAYQNAGAGNGDTVFSSANAVFSGFFTAAISINAPEYQSGGTKVVGARGAAVPDVTATTNISGSDMVNETTVLASIQALETKLNLLLSRLRSTTGHGLIT